MKRHGSTLHARRLAQPLAGVPAFWVNSGFGASPPAARHTAARVALVRRIFFKGALSEPKGTSWLRDVVSFYATGASNPARWYLSGGTAFDDTPSAYRGLMDTRGAPRNRRPGDAPARLMITAVVAFSATLTDKQR